MGRRPKPVELGDVVEEGVRAQIKTAANWKDRQEALLTAIRFMAVKAKIAMPDEGAGFNEEIDAKGDVT